MSDRLRLYDLPATLHQGQLDAHQGSIWTALPGIILSVDLKAMTCQVQPAIQAIERDPQGNKTDVSLPPLVDVPIVFPHGGPYAQTFPVAKDDECLVVFASRCIDNWWQSGGVQPQFEQRQHDLSDGIAIIGPWSQQTKLQNVADKTSQWRNKNGDIYAEVDDGNQKIRLIVKGITVEVDAQNSVVNVTGSDKAVVNVNKECDVTAGNQVLITSPLVKISGELRVTGNITAGDGNQNVTVLGHEHPQLPDSHGDVQQPTQPPRPGS